MNNNFTPINPPVFCPFSGKSCVEECGIRMVGKDRNGDLLDCCGIALIAKWTAKDLWYPLVRTISMEVSTNEQ